MDDFCVFSPHLLLPIEATANPRLFRKAICAILLIVTEIGILIKGTDLPMQTPALALCSLLALFVLSARAADTSLYLDNGVVRIGIDRSSGGSIFSFACVSNNVNLLNHNDRGRFIQQSYYGNADGSMWNTQPWRWNPVQGGDWKGAPAKLLASSVTTNAGLPCALFTRSIPKHWASGEDITNAVMEQTITLTNAMAHIRFRFAYSGTVAHTATHQELPAVFIDGAYTNLVFYGGDTPWARGTLTRAIPGWPNEGKRTTEHWAAYVNDADYGVGVFTPGTGELTCYRYTGDGKTGPEGSACSYFAPIRTMAITPGFTFEYDVWLTIGTSAEIRSRFQSVR